MPEVSMKQLLEAGVHFGHQTSRWNPKMKPYIFGARNGIYIIDLQRTVKLFEDAYEFVRDLAARGGSLLLVGTKKQAQDAIREEAERCGMFYVNTRWLGGTLTNFQTIKQSIDRLKKCEEMLEDPAMAEALPRREMLGCRANATAPAALAGRHQGDAQAARRAVRHRSEEGRDRRQGSQQAAHPRGRRGRYQLRSRRRSTTRSRETTMRFAPSVCSARPWPTRCSKAERSWRSAEGRQGRREAAAAREVRGPSAAAEERPGMSEVSAAQVRELREKDRRWHHGLQAGPGGGRR